ncbi:MAG: hypothetical protein Q4B86_07315 [Eubacteriales bacterium]|nr:hypothetical protein [Eubacteriales bacterium]
MEYIGVCKFCGQSRIVIGEDLEQDKVNALAYEECDCVGAKEEKRIKDKINFTEDNINELAKEDGDTVRRVLKEFIEPIARGTIKSATLKTSKGIKFAITDRVETIKVERAVTTKEVLES